MNTETFSEGAYQALLQDIFQRFPSVQQAGFSGGAYKPGLEQMQAFDQALGCPSRAFRSVHVAGTNGKGSVANMLASALSACGLKTGLYTSPHLIDFRERMLIADRKVADAPAAAKEESAPPSSPTAPGLSASQPEAQLVPKEYVFDFLTRWMPFIEEHNLSFFEITTGLAFKWFADSKVDVAVVETGLGGRLDSTNILQPELAVVTTIGLDHCALLGNTLPEIAAEKAGIFKPGVPALVGERQEAVADVFIEKAWMLCPLIFATDKEPSLWYRHEEILEQMDLRADVQRQNLRTVLTATDLLKGAFPALRDDASLLDGIIHTAQYMHFHGRWERLSDQPYVLADIGHNPQALGYNFAQLERLVQNGRFSSLIIVYGVMADKDLDGILPLMPRDATYIFATPSTPRALPADEILRRFTAYRATPSAGSPAAPVRAEAGAVSAGSPAAPVRAFACGSVREAVQMAVRLAQDLSGPESRSASAQLLAPPLIYIGGSTFVVADALPFFGR